MPEEFRARVEQLRGESGAGDSALVFEVDVSPTPGGYRLALQLRDAGGGATRLLELASCSEVVDTAALLIAMALDPPAQADAAAPPAPPPAPDPPVEPPVRERAVRWSGSLGATADSGVLPGWSVGPTLGLMLSSATLRFTLHGRYWWPREMEKLPAGANVEIDLFACALSGARLWSMRRFVFGPVIEGELGYLRGRASGVMAARTSGSLWAGAFAGGLLGFSLRDGLALELVAQAGTGFKQPQFALRGATSLHSPAPLLVRLMFGVSFRLSPRTQAPLAM